MRLSVTLASWLLIALAPAAAFAAQPDCSEATIRAFAPPDAIPMLDRAFDWVHRGVPYCQCVSGNGGPYRTDCSGFVSMVWQLPPAGHSTYSLGGGPWDDGASHVIGLDELMTGDAMNWPGDFSQRTGHVVLFAGWLDDAHTRYCAIEETFPGPGGEAHVQERFVEWRYLPIRLSSRQPCGPAHCEGSEIVSSCGRGDCGAYGLNCTQDLVAGTRCTFPGCPQLGEATICIGDRILARCVNGAIPDSGDCGAFGLKCVNDLAGPRCVYGGCPQLGEADICFQGSKLGHCVNGQVVSSGDCAAYGQNCIAEGSAARCGVDFCPSTGVTQTCRDNRHLVDCDHGAMLGEGDCGAYGAYCSTALGYPARCVSAFCVPDEKTTPVAHDDCWFQDARLLHCDARGAPALEDCPAGQACSVAGGRAHCAPAICPPEGTAKVCASDVEVGHCDHGAIVKVKDCLESGGFCSSAGGAHCAAAACVAKPGDKPVAHDLCLPDGRLARCDAQGVVQDAAACPEGQRCRLVNGAGSCGVDAPSPDAGASDGGSIAPDAGVTSQGDGGETLDPYVPSTGCGCGAGLDAIALGGLILGLRRRKGREQHA